MNKPAKTHTQMLYDEVCFLMACALYQYTKNMVGGSFRKEYAWQDIALIQSPLARKTDELYHTFLKEYRETERYQEWYYKHLQERSQTAMPGGDVNEYFQYLLDDVKDPQTGKLICPTRYSIFSKERFNRVVNNLEKRQIIIQKYIQDVRLHFHVFTKDQKIIDKIKKVSFMEAI